MGVVSEFAVVQDWVFLSDTGVWHGFCTQLQWQGLPWASS